MDGLGSRQRIVVIGAGGTGLLMADSIRRSPDKHLVGFLDDDVGKWNHERGGVPVLGGLSLWSTLPDAYCYISSLYGPKKNVDFFLRIRSPGIPESRWATVVDPTALVLSFVTLGCGVYVGPATVLEPNVSLGNWSVMLGNVYVAHDTQIGEYVACANSVSVAGGVTVGSRTFVGAHATIREYSRIGRDALIGMGSIVIRDVPDGSIVVGNPCRTIGKLSQADRLQAAGPQGPMDPAPVPTRIVERPAGTSPHRVPATEPRTPEDL